MFLKLKVCFLSLNAGTGGDLQSVQSYLKLIEAYLRQLLNDLRLFHRNIDKYFPPITY